MRDEDTLSNWNTGDYLFYSFSKGNLLLTMMIDEPFDYQVWMEFLELKGKIGEGGFGQVHLAWDKLNRRKVAVKILSSRDHPLSPNMIDKEIEALAKLKHRHIVRLYSWFPLPREHKIVLVMEFLEGGELQQYW